MAAPCVVSAIGTDAAYGLIGRYLGQQLWQHRRVANRVVSDLNRPDLQRLRVYGQMHLAPLPTVLGPVGASFPFAFAQELDTGGVHQQVQCALLRPVGQAHMQGTLTATNGAEIGHRPVQTGQLQQTLHHTQTLAQGQAVQAFDGQAKLDSRVRERLVTAPFAVGLGQPVHARVEPHRQ